MASSIFVAGPSDGLQGAVTVAGLKTAAVPLMAAAVAARGEVRIRNVPDLTDVRIMTQLAASVGVPVTHTPSDARVDVAGFASVGDVVVDDPVLSTCHGPLYLLPALAAVADRLDMRTHFGGCAIGDRPTTHIADVLAAGGHTVVREADRLVVRSGDPRDINLDLRLLDDWWVMRSGATKAAVILAAAERRSARLSSPYNRAPIHELLRFASLRHGAVGRVTDELLELAPGDQARAVDITVRGDYLEAITWLCATAVATGDVTVSGFDPDDCSAELDLLAQAGVTLTRSVDGVRAVVEGPLTAQSFTTDAIDTDAQPLLGTAMALARGAFTIEERIWSHRFGWADALRSNGADLTPTGPQSVEGRGVDRLSTDPVAASDLRAATALAVAALRQPVPTRIDRWEHVARGIDGFVSKLQSLGASVQEVTAPR